MEKVVSELIIANREMSRHISDLRFKNNILQDRNNKLVDVNYYLTKKLSSKE